MVKSIEEALDEEEIQKVRQLQKDMADKHEGDILENVRHIECQTTDTEAKVYTYESLHNPYAHLISVQKTKKKRPTESSERIRLQDVKASQIRKDILKAELRFRTRDIQTTKQLLTHELGYDVGLVMAAAYWLKAFSNDFYYTSNEHHEGAYRNYFEWEGMEKGIVIRAKNSQENTEHYVLVRRHDVKQEENLSQYVAGVATSREKAEKVGGIVRDCIKRMHITEHFCILK